MPTHLFQSTRLNSLIQSIRTRGLWPTMVYIRMRTFNHLFDLRYGTNTATHLLLYDLTITGSNKGSGKFYMPTGQRFFNHLIGSIHFPKGSVFVDLGSGKGKSLLLASRYGFKRIVGIEFSRELCQIARANVVQYSHRTNPHARIEVLEGDVVDYTFSHDENVFYMFNPFDARVLIQVLNNIEMSFVHAPRTIWLLYSHPLFAHVIETQSNFRKLSQCTVDGIASIVYVRSS